MRGLATTMILGFSAMMIACNSGGGGKVSVAIDDFSPLAAQIQYVDINCSLGGLTFEGVLFESCADGFDNLGIGDCASNEMTFPNFNGATDVEGVDFNNGEVVFPFQIINGCEGIVNGTYNGETGSCQLQEHRDSLPGCRCELTATLETSHNSDFAAQITAGITALREGMSSAHDLIFDGLADEENAVWDVRSHHNFTFFCADL